LEGADLISAPSIFFGGTMSSLIILKKNIHRPGTARLVAADKNEVEFLEKVQNQPMVKIFIDRADCEDYYPDYSCRPMKVHYPVKLVSIQGIPHLLKPGENLVSQAVYEFLEQNKQDKRDGDLANEELMRRKDATQDVLAKMQQAK
jgi:hypothetical protein